MKIHKINLKNKDTKYSIFIGNRALNLLGKQMKIFCPNTNKVALILDKNVPKKFKKKIKKSLNKYQVFVKEYLPNEKALYGIHLSDESLSEYGIEEGDIILSANGVKSETFADINKMVVVDGARNLKVLRGDNEKTIAFNSNFNASSPASVSVLKK